MKVWQCCSKPTEVIAGCSTSSRLRTCIDWTGLKER
ncbi:MAG: hypothetical protein GY845_14505 [Planctomycetes bacterium]|nr:hypothetical protein [Planctomycetota bacterium]